MAKDYFTPRAEEANGKWQHLVKYCLDKYEGIKDSSYRNKTIDEIAESVKAYDQDEEPTNDPWPGASNIQLPLTTISSDNLEPRLVAGLVGKKPYIQFEEENDQKQDDQTEILEEFYNQELEDVVKAEELAGNITHQLLQEGTVYVECKYDLDETTRSDFVFFEDVMRKLAPQIQGMQKQAQMSQVAAMEAQALGDMETAQQYAEQARAIIAESRAMVPPQVGGIVVNPETGEPLTQDVNDTVFEGGKAEIIPFKDVFIPDVCDEWEKAPVIKKIYPTYADLKNMSKDTKGWMNVGPWLCNYEGEETLDQDQKSAVQEKEGVEVTSKSTIECIVCSVNYIYRKEEDADEKEQKDFTEQRWVATIALESKILIRLMPLRELNFKNEHLIKRLRLFPRKGKAYGRSLYSKLRAIQKGASKTFNTAINITEITMIPWFLYDDRAGLDRKQGGKESGVKLEIGKGIKVANVQGVLFPRFSINPDQLINWINLWVSFWERLLSIGDLQIGRQGQEKRTATETMAVIQEGNIKHNYQSSNIKDDFLSILRTIYDLYYQYMPLDKTFLWKGKRVQIPRALMRRRYKFRLTGSTDMSNKLIERKEKEDIYQLTAEDPNINPIWRSENLLRAYGFTDTAEAIHPNIRMICEKIMQLPGADKLAMEAIKEAEAMAANMEKQVKGQGGGRPQ